MRKFLYVLALISTPLTTLVCPHPALHAATSGTPRLDKLQGSVNVQLQDPKYVDGIMSTDKGGIVTGQDLYIQAKDITYIRKHKAKDKQEPEHRIQAQGQLYMVYKNKVYRGSKVDVDLISGVIQIWDACTKNGDWFVGGKKIDILPEDKIIVESAYMSTSENQRNDWSIEAKTLTIIRGDSMHAQNVTFYFERLPLLWLPSYSRSLGSTERAPFKYRVRWGGSQKLRIGITYDFNQTGDWKNKALIDYSFKHGLGVGLLSTYKGASKHERFEMLNYLAQGKGHSLDPTKARYRLQGVYQNYYGDANLNFVGMYDKLSDSGMKSDFSDHPISDARPALTQATLWREEANWIARVNGRVRINNFQTVKQELPLLDFNLRPYALGNTRWMLANRISAGYLDYVYAKKTPDVRNFSSTRSEIAQKLYTTYTYSPFICTPSIGYRCIHYSSSPQHDQRLQLLGEAGLTLKTRLVRPSISSFQAVEPYFSAKSILHPTVRSGKAYIFDLEDGWNRVNDMRFGFQHSYIRSADLETGFQQRVYTDLYTRSFFGTRHMPSHPTKIWLDSVFDATPTVSYKLQSAYDFHHGTVDHINIATRHTLSKNAAFTLEYRQRSKYAWRKIDYDNFVVEAAHSARSLRRSQMSDERRTILASLFWSPIPNLDLECTSTHGFRRRSPKYYHDAEISVATIVRGALHLKLIYGIRSGREHRWYISFGLGAKKGSSSTGFRKIGDGNYDIW